MSESISSKSQFSNYSLEYRCPECSLIPFIEISSNDNKLTMKTKCTNGHTFNDDFDKMQMMCKSIPKSKYFCALCKKENKVNKIDEILFYCSICFKFFCYNHGKNVHKLKDGHNFYFNECYDNACFEHQGNSLIGYCVEHNKNYCKNCIHFNENNKNIEEELNVQQIEKYEKEIDNNKQILNEIDVLFKNYKKAFNELEKTYSLYKQNIIKRINFMNEIVIDYKNKLKVTALNYQMKANIIINNFDLLEIKQKINDKISKQNKEVNELIKILKRNEVAKK